jgi:2-polyprenyl-6-methoxyphenol hydroxylase-like FAD-dependent oxidoreductase
MMPDTELFVCDPKELKDYVLDRISTWHPGLQDIVHHWDVSTVQPLVQRSCVPVDRWQPSAVTAVGDAVHAMSNALGIGANTALWDADVLGSEIIEAARKHKSLLAAVGDYESAMRDVGFGALRRSAMIGHHIIGHRNLPTEAM